MNRFLIGVGLGAPLGVALMCYALRCKMFYRIAFPTGQDYQFWGGVCDTDEAIRHILRVRMGMGQDVSHMMVFGASTIGKLEDGLQSYNAGNGAVAVTAVELLQGRPFTAQVIRNSELLVEKQPKTEDAVVWANSLPQREYNRLAFARWLYMKGKINEGEAPPAEPRRG